VLRELEDIINKKNSNINKNGLKISENIKKFNKIVELNLNNCGLDILLDSFGGLKSLKILGLEDNYLASLPRSFSKLKSL